MSSYTVKLTSDTNSAINEYAHEMLKSGQLTDCILKSLSADSDDSYEIACHSLILSAYSSFFTKCFTSKAGENSRSESVRIICLDMKTKTLENIINLLYTGKCTVLGNDFPELRSSLEKLKILYTSQISQTASATSAATAAAAAATPQENKTQPNQLKRRLTSDMALDSIVSQALQDFPKQFQQQQQQDKHEQHDANSKFYFITLHFPIFPLSTFYISLFRSNTFLTELNLLLHLLNYCFLSHPHQIIKWRKHVLPVRFVVKFTSMTFHSTNI